MHAFAQRIQAPEPPPGLMRLFGRWLVTQPGPGWQSDSTSSRGGVSENVKDATGRLDRLLNRNKGGE